MRIKEILLILGLSLLLTGCYKEKTVDIPIGNEFNSEEVVKDNSDMKNVIDNKNEINIVDNYENIINLDLRNSTVVKKYSESINLIKDFCENNSVELIFVEPIHHRISRMDHLINYHELLVNLQLAGAETVSYFTDEDILNVELSISIGDNSYSHITYKASIQNLNQNFEFKESKLNEFRKTLVATNELDFDILDKYIKDIFNNQIDEDMIFFNKIDEDRYETIRIENNNCYYKLIYNPKL